MHLYISKTMDLEIFFFASRCIPHKQDSQRKLNLKKKIHSPSTVQFSRHCVFCLITRVRKWNCYSSKWKGTRRPGGKVDIRRPCAMMSLWVWIVIYEIFYFLLYCSAIIKCNIEFRHSTLTSRKVSRKRCLNTKFSLFKMKHII